METGTSWSEAFGGIVGLAACGFAALFFVLFIASAIWVYSDAERRGKTGCLWVLIAWFTFPFGLIAYFLLRDREVKL